MNPSKTQEQKQSDIDNFNKLDIGLKEWRDNNTSSQSFVEDMNHTLEDLGERGFSYSKMNSLMGNQIAQHSRTIEDRRYLGLLDEIKTPGGSWGNTQEGLKLKQVTSAQINADQTRKVQSERASRLEAKDIIVHRLKKEIGTIHFKKRGLTDPAKIAEEESNIKKILEFAFGNGIGDEVQNYYTSMVDGIDKGFKKGQARVLKYTDRIDPSGKNTETVKDRLIEVLKDPSSDFSVNQRTIMLNNEFAGENITLDKDGLDIREQMIKEFVPTESTEHYKQALARFNQEATNSQLRYKESLSRAQKLVAGADQTKEIPLPLTRLIDGNRTKFIEAYKKTFSEYSDTLEELEENPRYGYGGWSPNDRTKFNDVYNDNVAGIIDTFKKEVEEYHNGEGKKVVVEEASHEEMKRKNSVKVDAPLDYSELEDMLYNRSGGIAVTNDNQGNKIRVTKETLILKLREAIIGLTPGATKAQKEAASSNVLFADIGTWYKSSIGGSNDEVKKSEKLEAIWKWSLYLIKRDQLNKIDRSNRSGDAKKELKTRFTKTLEDLKFPSLNL
jgi:hypothetical protein